MPTAANYLLLTPDLPTYRPGPFLARILPASASTLLRCRLVRLLCTVQQQYSVACWSLVPSRASLASRTSCSGSRVALGGGSGQLTSIGRVSAEAALCGSVPSAFDPRRSCLWPSEAGLVRARAARTRVTNQKFKTTHSPSRLHTAARSKVASISLATAAAPPGQGR